LINYNPLVYFLYDDTPNSRQWFAKRWANIDVCEGPTKFANDGPMPFCLLGQRWANSWLSVGPTMDSRMFSLAHRWPNQWFSWLLVGAPLAQHMVLYVFFSTVLGQCWPNVCLYRWLYTVAAPILNQCLPKMFPANTVGQIFSLSYLYS